MLLFPEPHDMLISTRALSSYTLAYFLYLYFLKCTRTIISFFYCIRIASECSDLKIDKYKGWQKKKEVKSTSMYYQNVNNMYWDSGVLKIPRDNMFSCFN